MSKKIKNFMCLVLVNIIALVYICLTIQYPNSNNSNTANPPQEYMISTHYFASEWPMNFWNAEWDTIDHDFEQIREDGFNTIIIVIPWREFQPEVSPVKYNEVAWDRLQSLFEKAKEHYLNVSVRAGYIHDFLGEDNSADRFYEVIWDADARNAWYDYMEHLYKACSANDNFAGGFITWEDFWHNYALVDYVGGTEAGLDYARRDSFDVFLSEKYTLDEFNTKYHTDFAEFYDVYIPSRTDGFVSEWYEHMDNITLLLLQETRHVFPGLFMEVRTDDDRVLDQDGNVTYFSHKETWDCADGHMTGIMYKISQGLHVSEDTLTAKDAIISLENWLSNIYENNGHIPIYMEQFLFFDNTPGYSGGDLISAINADEYFAGCVPVLKEYTNGYGVWIYKDYCNNLLYNPQFALALDGWDINGNTVCCEKDSGSKACLLEGGTITQNIPHWRKSLPTESEYIFSMNYSTVEEAAFTISVGEQVETVVVSGEGEIVLHFKDEYDMYLSISCIGKAYIDDLKLYNFVSTQQLYDMKNQEKIYIENVRTMNHMLME